MAFRTCILFFSFPLSLVIVPPRAFDAVRWLKAGRDHDTLYADWTNEGRSNRS